VLDGHAAHVRGDLLGVAQRSRDMNTASALRATRVRSCVAASRAVMIT
jgi:hypothetical protein